MGMEKQKPDGRRINCLRKGLVGIFATSICIIITAYFIDICDREYFKWFVCFAKFFFNEGASLVSGILAIWAIFFSVVLYVLTRMDSAVYGIERGRIIKSVVGERWGLVYITAVFCMLPLLFWCWIREYVVCVYVLFMVLLFVLFCVMWFIYKYDDSLVYEVVYIDSQKRIREIIKRSGNETLQQSEVMKTLLVEMIDGIDYSSMEQSERVVNVLKMLTEEIVGYRNIRNHKILFLFLQRACLAARKNERSIWLLKNYWNEIRNLELDENIKDMLVLIVGLELIIENEVDNEQAWLRLFRMVSSGNRRMMTLIVIEYIMYMLDVGINKTILWQILDVTIKQCDEPVYLATLEEPFLYECWMEWHRTDKRIDARMKEINALIKDLKTNGSEKGTFVCQYIQWKWGKWL